MNIPREFRNEVEKQLTAIAQPKKLNKYAHGAKKDWRRRRINKK